MDALNKHSRGKLFGNAHYGLTMTYQELTCASHCMNCLASATADDTHFKLAVELTTMVVTLKEVLADLEEAEGIKKTILFEETTDEDEKLNDA